MSEPSRFRIAPFGDLIFAVCAAGAAWLLFKHAPLLMALPWEQAQVTLQGVAAAARDLLSTVLPLALIVLAIGLGWIAARPASKSARREVRHE